MTRRILIYVSLIAALAVAVLLAQDINTSIIGTGSKPALAVVDFRGRDAAQPLMGAFNSTVYSDLQNSGLFDLRPKSMFPLNNPQTPADLRPEDAGAGYALKDWAGAPVNASHLVFGYTAVVNGVLALYGDVYDTRQQDLQSAQLFAKTYAGSPDEAGAIHVAHEFANDIIQKFGGSGSLLNSRIYFISSRGATGKFGTELWAMDWDGNNQTQLTHLGGQVLYPAISPDGSRLAVTFYPNGRDPQIDMINSQTGRPLPFYNQDASINASASFSPDGTKIYYSSTASGEPQIYSAGIDGRGFSPVTSSRGNPTEPKVNPKNPNSLLFVQGFPNVQVYKMNAEGAGIERVTNGEGEAANPAWSPDGQHVAFAWTRGYAKGDFNIFVIDIGSPQNYNQLTHSEGKNENPVWAPDSIHLVFTRTPKTGQPQIFTMLSNGTQVKQLTTQGSNRYPVWGVK